MVEPVSIYVDLKDATVSQEKVIECIQENFNLSQRGIIDFFDLKRPMYQKTATYGHFGRDDVPWEELRSVELFQKLRA